MEGTGWGISGTLLRSVKLILCNVLQHMSTEFTGICSQGQMRGKRVEFVSPLGFFFVSPV